MTRETKIGIAVAVSFLCLVGIVVATKWRRDPIPNKEDSGAVAKGKTPETQTNPPVKPDVQAPLKPADYRPDQSNPPPKPLPNMGVGNEPPVGLPPVNANAPMSELPPPVAALPNPSPMSNTVLPSLPMDDPLKNLGNLITQQNKQSDVPPPPVALPGAFQSAEKGANDALNKVGNVADNAVNKANDQFKKGVGAFNQGIDDLNKQTAPLPQSPMALAPSSPGAQVPSVPGLPDPAKVETKAPSVPEPARVETKAPSIPGLPEPPKAVTQAPAVPGLPEPAKVDTKGSSAPGLPEPAKAETKSPSVPGLSTTPTVETKAPATPSLPGVALPPITNSNAAGKSNNGPIPVIPMAKPEVATYESRQYMAQPGDTFASISKSAYGDDRLANALLAYNRDFSSNRTMTAPQAGQLILLPPPQVLQQSRYAGALADARPSIGAAPVSISPPVPVIPARTFTPSTPTTDATKSYRIPPAGQLIYELAVQTLGDGNRWAEIYRLNPTIDPLRPIPGSTVVRLPGNARVP